MWVKLKSSRKLCHLLTPYKHSYSKNCPWYSYWSEKVVLISDGAMLSASWENHPSSELCFTCTLKETFYLCFQKCGIMYIYVRCTVSSPLYRRKRKIGLVPNHVEHATWKEQRHLENHSTISEEITGEIPDDWKNSPWWDSYFISQFHLDFFFPK